MKALLVCPQNPERFYDFVKLPPLGVAYVAAALRAAGHQVEILDTTLVRRPEAAFAAAVAKYEPAIVGFSASASTFKPALALAGHLRRARPNAQTVFGGVHPTWRPAEVAAEPAVDYVVFGEGEVTAVELFNALEKGQKPVDIKGVAFRNDGTVVVNEPRQLVENLDSLPLPAYDLLPVTSYSTPQASRLPLMAMITSRGCPYHCIFCDAHLVFGRKYRFHSPERTFAEMLLLKKRFAVRQIAFKDSEFTLNLERVDRLCDLIISERLDLLWTCNGRVGRLPLPLLQKMRRAGCRMIWYGVESGDQSILETLKKQITLDEARETFRLTRLAKIRTVANFLVGNPGETSASLAKTLNLALELKPDFVNFLRLVPYPGTALLKMAEASGWLKGGPDMARSAPDRAMNATALTDEQLEQAYRRLYRRFYLRPSYLIRRAFVTTAHGWKTNARGLLKLLQGG